MNELLISLMATLQALLLAVSAQGAMSTEQMAAATESMESAKAILQASVPLQQLQSQTQPKTEVREVNKDAAVNILCTTRGGGTFNPISGSGVIIDQRGIILTNAHVAQYVLLQTYLKNSSIKCAIRIGAPARAKYTAEVLFMPQTWVKEHAQSIKQEIQTGTGEHDYALLVITGRTDGESIGNTVFPTLNFNLGESVVAPGSSVLLAGYPAGFLGGAIIQRNLWPVSTWGHVEKLMTFKSGSVDVLGLGGSIVAQAGSSGGAVVNRLGNLVGIITTSSQAPTTDKRDLRAITLSHINESMQTHTRVGLGLMQFLSQDITTALEEFKKDQAKRLIEVYNEVLN